MHNILAAGPTATEVVTAAVVIILSGLAILFVLWKKNGRK